MKTASWIRTDIQHTKDVQRTTATEVMSPTDITGKDSTTLKDLEVSFQSADPEGEDEVISKAEFTTNKELEDIFIKPKSQGTFRSTFGRRAEARKKNRESVWSRKESVGGEKESL